MTICQVVITLPSVEHGSQELQSLPKKPGRLVRVGQTLSWLCCFRFAIYRPSWAWKDTIFAFISTMLILSLLCNSSNPRFLVSLEWYDFSNMFQRQGRSSNRSITDVVSPSVHFLGHFFFGCWIWGVLSAMVTDKNPSFLWCVAIESGPSAHALAQQCCVNVAKRVQHHATFKILHEKFDRFQIWSNMLQNIARGCPNVRNTLCRTMLQDVARCCVEMLRAFGQALINTLTILEYNGLHQ